MPYQAVYFQRRLCCFEWTPSYPTSDEAAPTLDCYWWPLSEPTSMYMLTNVYGTWNGTEITPSWDGHVLERYGSRQGYYLGDTYLPLLEVNGKHWALAVAHIPYPRPPHRADTELRWHYDQSPLGLWQKYSRKDGWRHVDTRYQPRMMTADQYPLTADWKLKYFGQFEYLHGETWKPYGDMVVPEQHMQLVKEAQPKEVPV